MHHFNSSPVLSASFISHSRSPGEHCVHGVASPHPSGSHGGSCSAPPSGPDTMGVPDGERQEGTGQWYHRSAQTPGTVLYTEQEHTHTRTHMHTYHMQAVIYCSNKSLALPNFLWISISPWTYLHWSTSGRRMCQMSLSVTLKNGLQTSIVRVSECVCVCGGIWWWDLCICSISVHRGFRIQILECE